MCLCVCVYVCVCVCLYVCRCVLSVSMCVAAHMEATGNLLLEMEALGLYKFAKRKGKQINTSQKDNNKQATHTHTQTHWKPRQNETALLKGKVSRCRL